MTIDAADNARAAPGQEPSPANQAQRTTDETTRSHGSTHTPLEVDKGEIESASPPAAGVSASQTTKFSERSNLHQRLLTMAMDVRLAALHARSVKYEHDYEIAAKTASTQGVSISRKMQIKKDAALRMASLASALAKQAKRNDWAHQNTDMQNTTTWFIQYLFGDTGILNLYQHLSQSSQAVQSSVLEANTGDSGQPIDLMDEVLQTYQKLVKSGQAIEDSYLARFQLLIDFQDQHKTLWCKFLQAGSKERRALLLQSKDEGLLADSEDNSLTIRNSKLQDLAWKWIERKTGHTKDTIEKRFCVSHHLMAMMRVLGRGVLCFMDKRLEAQ
jgi:hypothetical protein